MYFMIYAILNRKQNGRFNVILNKSTHKYLNLLIYQLCFMKHFYVKSYIKIMIIQNYMEI